jgi:hypothetical protein
MVAVTAPTADGIGMVDERARLKTFTVNSEHTRAEHGEAALEGAFHVDAFPCPH